MRISKALLAAAVAAFFFGWVCPADAFSVTYDLKMNTGGKSVDSKVKLKDTQFRMESVIDGMPTITVRNNDGIFSYIPSQNMAVKLPDVAIDNATQPTENYMSYLHSNNASLLRSETVNGYFCDVYEFMDPQTSQKTTAWIWKEKDFPVKFILNTPQGEVASEMTNIIFNAAIDPTAFTLPAEAKIVPMSQIMQAGSGSTPNLTGLLGNAPDGSSVDVSKLQQKIKQLQGQDGAAAGSSEGEQGSISDPALQQLLQQLGEQLGAGSQKSH